MRICLTEKLSINIFECEFAFGSLDVVGPVYFHLIIYMSKHLMVVKVSVRVNPRFHLINEGCDITLTRQIPAGSDVTSWLDECCRWVVIMDGKHLTHNYR